MSDIVLHMSVRNVRVHFFRTILAALGITIGVIAIASMGMLGTNMTLSVKDQLSSMGNKLVVTKYTGTSTGGSQSSSAVTAANDDNLTDIQLNDIKRIVGQSGLVYGLHQTRDVIRRGKDSWRSTIYGVDSSLLPDILPLSDGNYPSGTNSVIIGPSLVTDNNLDMGTQIIIGDVSQAHKSVRVIGIIEARGISLDLNSDRAIVMPEKAYTSLYGGENKYDQVNIALNNIDDVSMIETAINDQMNRRSQTVRIQDSSRLLTSITSTLSTLTSFVSAIAGISLLVAAISIFNIMMMSVMERIREIGVLRSIGTQKSEILRMFLYEAGIIGLIGSGIGLLLSLIIGYVFISIMVGNTNYFFTYDSLISLPYAMVIGLLICILSGIYPAWRGANMDPIEALRAD